MFNDLDKCYLDVEKEIKINEGVFCVILALPYGSETFIGECNWLGKIIRLEVKSDIDNIKSADNSLKILRKLISQADNFDLSSKYSISKALLNDVNLCNPKSNITQQEFMSRIELDDLGIYGDKIYVGYATNGMFDSMETNMMIIASFNIDENENFFVFRSGLWWLRSMIKNIYLKFI